MSEAPLVPAEPIEELLHLVRGHRVMLDSDLARLYGVATKALLQAMKRNRNRFPADFAFQLSAAEFATLRSQSVTSSWGGRRYRPFAFTQEGVSALSAVLRSSRAERLFVRIMRAFVRMRAILAGYPELLKRLAELERGHSIHDEKLNTLLLAVHEHLSLKTAPVRHIGFLAPAPNKKRKGKSLKRER